MKKLYLILILGCSLMLSSGKAAAESCHNITCSSLGYTFGNLVNVVNSLGTKVMTSINADCKTSITCPIAGQWESNMIACVTYKTFTSGSCPTGAQCAMRYKITSCKSGYTLSQDRTKCVESTHEVVLTEVGSNKLRVIKAVQTITGLGTKEAKELVDNVPSVIKSGVTPTEAAEIKKTLEDLGASVEIK